jgi:hypothetical protein
LTADPSLRAERSNPAIVTVVDTRRGAADICNRAALAYQNANVTPPGLLRSARNDGGALLSSADWRRAPERWRQLFIDCLKAIMRATNSNSRTTAKRSPPKAVRDRASKDARRKRRAMAHP